MYKLNVLSMALFIVFVSSFSTVPAQKKPEPPVSQLCTRSSALDMIQQQNAMAKTMDNPVQRIAVMLRIAEMSWPYQH